MESGKKARGGSWTEAEKISVLWQIIVLQGGSIPWAKLQLPEGRTLKAAQVMLDRERQRIKQEMAADSAEEGSGDNKRDGTNGESRKTATGTKKKAPAKAKSTIQKRTLSEAAFDSDEDGDAEFHVPKSTTNSSRKKAKSRADTPAAIKTEEVSDDLLT